MQRFKAHHVLSFVVACVASTAVVLAADPVKPGDTSRLIDQAIESRFGDVKDTRRATTPSTQDVRQSETQALVTPAQTAATTATEPVRRESLPLGAARSPAIEKSASSSGGFMNHWAVRTIGALAIVIGLIFATRKGLVMLGRTGGGISSQFGVGGRAPSGVLEILGRYPVSRGHTLVLLKMDRRILLLGHSSSGFTTLSQVDDEEEVASLLLRTRDEEEVSMAARFSALLRGMERDPSVAAETEPVQGPSTPRSILRRVASEQSAEQPQVEVRSRNTSEAGDELVRRLERLKGVRA